MNAVPDLSLRSAVVAAGRPARHPGAPLSPDLVLSSTFHADGTIPYGRDGNPTWSALESVLGTLDSGSAVTFASGTAATAAVLETLPVGSVVVAPDVAYQGSSALLDQVASAGRLEVRRVRAGDTDACVAAMRGASLVWTESASNPTLEVTDVPTIAEAARHHGAVLVVDATFVTPLVQRPLELGADVVVHSATKFLAGHSDVLLGVVVARDRLLAERLGAIRHDRGAVPGPFEAWLTLRGIRTLGVRIDRAQANATELAQRLSTHPAVSRVRHPSLPDHPGHAIAARDWDGFGAVLSVEVRADATAAEQVAASTRLWAHATSLGGVESTLERRRRWPTEAPAVPDTLIRLSVGIEDVEDLWTDLAQALATVR